MIEESEKSTIEEAEEMKSGMYFPEWEGPASPPKELSEQSQLSPAAKSSASSRQKGEEKNHSSSKKEPDSILSEEREKSTAKEDADEEEEEEEAAEETTIPSSREKPTEKFLSAAKDSSTVLDV